MVRSEQPVRLPEPDVPSAGAFAARPGIEVGTSWSNG
jgi:hypothetical protein